MSDKNISFSMLVDERWGRPLAIQIAEMLAERIISGEVKAGERLKEAELANMFGTSRAPVREAVYLLQIDGLVEHVPRRGTIVREYTDQDIEDLYEVRRALECAAIDRLGPRWDEGTERKFKAIL